MNANILIDPLPDSVVIDGERIPVNPGYRVHILIEICMFSDRDDEQKLLDALHLFYGMRMPSDIDAALEQLLWFHRCGVNPEEEEKQGRHGAYQKQLRAYCFEQDAGMIYAAFRAQYGINLNQTPDADLHWWEFKAMFESLREDLLISRVMYYRTANISGMSKNEKAFIKKMRSIYAIRQPEVSMDAKARLAARNNHMLEYVRSRTCKKE